MNDDNTAWQQIEPTTPVFKRPIEPTAHMPNPYEDSIPIPPPPPKQRRTRFVLFITLLLVVLLLLAVGSVGAYFYLQGYSRQHTSNQTMPVSSPTPTQYTYDAKSIVQDFANAGLNVGQPVAETLSGYPHIPERGAYRWYVYGSYMSLSVYNNSNEAQNNGYHAEVASGHSNGYDTNLTYIVRGPCLLVYDSYVVGPGDIDQYGAVMHRYCV